MRLSKLSFAVSMSLITFNSFSNNQIKNEITTELDAVTVTATRTQKTVINSAQAINVISSEQIEANLDSNIFNALATIPNVTSNGGPRNGGHKFNIRGFSDAEDVQVTINGMVQTFEKYRMGSLFTDAELYKSISIKRGPSTVLHGGGALGGLVQLELKNAADFLNDDESFGAKIKIGYDSNNDQKNTTAHLFARPTDNLDILASVVNRRGNDFELSNDQKLENSPVSYKSVLFKSEHYLNDESLIGLNFSQTNDDQRTEFNVTDPGGWGTVYRETELTSANVDYEYSSDSNKYINLVAKAGFTSSDITESDGSTDVFSFFAGFIGLESQYQYNITTFDIMNTSQLHEHVLTYGIQYTDKERIGNKTELPCLKLNPQTRQCEEYGKDPVTNEIASQPSGMQKKTGIYIQDEFDINDINIVVGLRYEKYSTSASAQFENKFSSLETSVDHSDWASSVSANYNINDQWAVFANHQTGFRAPLIDELYDQYSRRNPGLNLEIEHSDNTEIGLTYQNSNVFTDVDSLSSRFLYFDTNINDEITSVTSEALNPSPNARYGNRGENSRDGIEFELNYANQNSYLNFSYSQVEGKDKSNKPLLYLPADKAVLNTGIYLFDNKVSLGLTVKRTSSRDVYVQNSMDGSITINAQDGYTLVGLNSNWNITDDLNLKLIIDNLTNREYTLIAGTGGGIGDYGLGKNIKTQLSYRF